MAIPLLKFEKSLWPKFVQQKLLPTGFWHYDVWEQVSTTNLTEWNAGSLVESGMANVIGTATNYIEHAPTLDYKSYGTGTV